MFKILHRSTFAKDWIPLRFFTFDNFLNLQKKVKSFRILTKIRLTTTLLVRTNLRLQLSIINSPPLSSLHYFPDNFQLTRTKLKIHLINTISDDAIPVTIPPPPHRAITSNEHFKAKQRSESRPVPQLQQGNQGKPTLKKLKNSTSFSN